MIQKLLITGASGYLGGRIIQDLSLDESFILRITAPEDLPWMKTPGIQVVDMDLLNDLQLHAGCSGINTIIHLAALNEIESGVDPDKALLINSLGTLKLLRAAKAQGVKRFIYFSTAHIYAAPLQGFIDEDTLPRPIHPYAISHRTAEDFVLSNSNKGLKGVVLRLSNALGSPAHPAVNRWSLVVNDLCRQVASHGAIQLRSSGRQMRDFITITDVCSATRHIIGLTDKALGNGIYNLGGENSLRIIEVAEIIARRSQALLGFTPPIRTLPTDAEEDNPLEYSIDKIKKTGFTLKGNLESSIDETLLFCKNHFGEGS